MEKIVRSKIRIPPWRANLVPRRRLHQRLDSALQQGYRFILVSAPAGSGKTTLLSEWLRSFTGGSAVWVTLDEGDNDPFRFLAYLANAVSGSLGGSKVGNDDLVPIRGNASLEDQIISLVNDLAALAKPMILALDNYEVITAQPVHNAVNFLIKQQPAKLKIVLCGRVVPPIALAGLFARGELMELGFEELRFTHRESKAFFRRTMNLELPSQQLSAIEAKTEGWVAGMQLVGLSMQRKTCSPVLAEIIHGSQRFVSNYLLQEVFSQQPLPVQRFLLYTAVLDRMCASLCDAILGSQPPLLNPSENVSLFPDSSGHAMLEYLNQSNLFTFPLDEQQHWYRYHNLWAEFLQDHLARVGGVDQTELHRRASAWFEQEGLLEDALHHALQGKDWQHALRLVETAGEQWLLRGELATLQRWLSAFSPELIASNPRLGILKARERTLAGSLDEVEAVLSSVERALNGAQRIQSGAAVPTVVSNNEIKVFRGYAALCRANVARSKENWEGMTALLDLALIEFPEDERAGRSLAYLGQGVSYRMHGELGATQLSYEKARHSAIAGGQLYVIYSATKALTELLIEGGELRQAWYLCEQTLADQDSGIKTQPEPRPATAIIHTCRARLLFEWNDLEQSLYEANKAVELCERLGMVSDLIDSLLIRSQIQRAIGNMKGACDTMQQAVVYSDRQCVPAYQRASIFAQQARLWIYLGTHSPDYLEAASAWAAQASLDIVSTPIRLDAEHLTLADLLIAKGELGQADALLKSMGTLAEMDGRRGLLLDILVLKTSTFWKLGKPVRAKEILARALSLGEPQGYLRTFLKEDEAIIALLPELAAAGHAASYARQILSALQGKNQKRLILPTAFSFEPLTEREKQVLRLMSTGRNGPQIAAEMVVSINTVKAHIKSIYQKLNVNKRFDAIKRGQDIGLLDTS
jgi:LuxR family transcriptional regulator, maltose regulon positive regulatory protein